MLEDIVADAGYESEENYLYLKANQLNSYIKPSNYEILKKRKYKLKYGKVENMEYSAEGDFFVCHNGKKLLRIGTRKDTTTTGFVSEKALYR